MSLSDLDIARAQYLWALHRHRPTLDDRIRDLAGVFGVLMEAEQQRRAVDEAPATTGPEPLRVAPVEAARAA